MSMTLNTKVRYTDSSEDMVQQYHGHALRARIIRSTVHRDKTQVLALP